MSLDKEPMPSLTLEELKDAAAREDWDSIDTALGDGERQDYIEWARGGGMDDEDGNLRDLAVSILEKSPDELGEDITEKLLSLMGNDENPYVRYRSAFVLYGHDIRNAGIEAVLQEALKDEDVAEIARGYLDSE